MLLLRFPKDQRQQRFSHLAGPKTEEYLKLESISSLIIWKKSVFIVSNIWLRHFGFLLIVALMRAWLVTFLFGIQFLQITFVSKRCPQSKTLEGLDLLMGAA
jgi:hypothetical protein